MDMKSIEHSIGQYNHKVYSRMCADKSQKQSEKEGSLCQSTP